MVVTSSYSIAQEIPLYTQPDFRALTYDEIRRNYNQFDFNATLPTNNSPLDQKHVSDEEISAFVKKELAEILTFPANGIDQKLRSRSNFFTVEGYGEFTTFLQASGLYELNTAQNKTITSIIVDDPVILNEASVGGAYRWLMEAIVLTSPHSSNFKTSGFNDYVFDPNAQTKHLDILTQTKRKYLIQIQLMRIAQNNGTEHGLAIEVFSASEFEGEL
tara:strand:- start:230 stop:880 length:651 start_codon:yes stop_codon:yes gene_type:complete